MMKQLTSEEIRSLFLAFFEEKGHEIKPSASLIPVNDPSLLWINSGVATLKKYFDGTEKPDNPRITNSQKSIRTNDIENVGYTARHHTLFEMLGNFSIGDYFKEEAIHWAWEFLTSEKWLGFKPEDLYVTYYPEDLETKAIWEKIPDFISNHLIVDEENFWDIGSGPCGPNTEIYFDRGEEYNNLPADNPESYPSGENERWLEIWNLVFSEFNHMPDGTYQPLPHKNIDTGMGLERLVSVIQETPTNFETDLFMPIIKQTEVISGVDYETAEDLKVSFKVIADHIRAVAFAISDGALPSNEGRGYIIRRLIRRSVMHGRRLGIKEPFLSQLVPTIVSIMGSFYQNLADKADFVQEIIRSEEDRFHETIEGGEQQLSQLMADLKAEGKSEISGSDAFQLYDTFGFPLELTQEEAEQHGFTVDEVGFETEMEQQRARARAARSDEDSMKVQSAVLSDIDAPFEFVGYDTLYTNATVTALVSNDQVVNQLKPGETGWVFFNRSSFYAEMGGQIADVGAIYDGNEVVAKVLDVQKAPNGQFMHKVETAEFPLFNHQSYTLMVDRKSRMLTEKNHTATHLLHAGLRKYLGEHVHQAGSYVGPDRLRFDFSHFGKVSPEELQEIENYVNHWIQLASDVMISEMTFDEAKELGAMALFGEKYGDIVRVVNIGNESIELCGGTHVRNTNEIASFKIVSEFGIGAGVRRIEAVTGQAVIKYYQERDAILQTAQSLLKAGNVDQIPHRIETIQAELKRAQSEVESLSAKALANQSAVLFDDVKHAGDVSYLAIKVSGQSVEQLRQMGDMWRDKAPSDILVVASDNGDSANLLVFVEEETSKAIKAGDLIKPLAKMIQGGGGGRPTMAQAGGKKPAEIDAMLAQVAQEIEKISN